MKPTARQKVRLTDKVVRDLSAPERGYSLVYDDGGVRGFALRITARGIKAFVLNYHADGRDWRQTIGKYPEWSVAAARDRAKQLRRIIALDGNPMRERQAERSAPTVNDLADRFVEEHGPKLRPSTRTDYESVIKHYIRPILGRDKVDKVSYADIDRLYRRICEKSARTRGGKSGSHFQANRTLAVLSKMFNMAIRWNLRADNPCRGVERKSEEKRARYLSMTELRRLTDALTGYQSQEAKDTRLQRRRRKSVNAIRLLLLTGARRGEVLSATWDQFDFERKTWTKPSAHTKQKKAHTVPLSAPALELLQGMKKESEGSYLFPGPNRDQPQGDLKKAWAKVCEIAELEGVRIHDLRHSFASILASGGASLPLIGALLGHTQPATTHRYAHLMDDPLRVAAESVGAIVEGRGEASVVQLRNRKS